MSPDFAVIQELVNRPGESLSVELKRWIDPNSPEGIAKIVKASLALRNLGGGYLVIGFDNKTLLPDIANKPTDVTSVFHLDKIQHLITKFSSEPFEVTVEFPERDSQAFPVIVVPPGIKTPVAVKADLWNDDKKIIATDDIYVRSLNANNTPSSTKATWKDWSKLVEVCFDNREADIGRFLRRHLSGVSADSLRDSLFLALDDLRPQTTIKDLLTNYLQESDSRFKKVVSERKISLPDHGTWEVALQILGDAPEHQPDLNFLNLLDASNPNYSGWPVLLVSRSFHEKAHRPYVFDETWEEVIISLGEDIFSHIDFVRLSPKGRFYLRRCLEDDISRNNKQGPFKVMDFVLPILRCAEAIAVGIAFSKAMGYKTDNTSLNFVFRWTRLQGRELSSWANPERYLSPYRTAYQDTVISYVTLSIDTPLSALSEYVGQAVHPLFSIFDGFVLSNNVIEDLTRRLIERKM